MPPTLSTLLPYWSPPTPITVAILGTPRLIVHERDIPIRGGGKSETMLLTVALAHRAPTARFTLLTALWPNEEPTIAGNALNTLTAELNKKSRTAIRAARGRSDNLICHEEGQYRLHSEIGVGTDVEYFDQWSSEGLRRLKAGDGSTGLTYCKKALALYRGDIGGDSLPALLERERLRATRLDLLTALADYHVRQTEWEAALDCLRQLLTVEPCCEDGHRQMMRCYVKLGRRGQALRQFQLCTQLLDREFAATPEPATVTLFDQIRLDAAGA